MTLFATLSAPLRLSGTIEADNWCYYVKQGVVWKKADGCPPKAKRNTKKKQEKEREEGSFFFLYSSPLFALSYFSLASPVTKPGYLLPPVPDTLVLAQWHLLLLIFHTRR